MDRSRGFHDTVAVHDIIPVADEHFHVPGTQILTLNSAPFNTMNVMKTIHGMGSFSVSIKMESRVFNLQHHESPRVVSALQLPRDKRELLPYPRLTLTRIAL